MASATSEFKSSEPPLFSLDLEDHREVYPARGGRYQEITLKVLDFLEERDIRGTVFVVGRVAETASWLVQTIAERGHEIACHSYCHRPLTRETPAQFSEETRRAKAVLEQACGQPVLGYRAPVFSITSETTWVVDLLQEMGFEYSSSVMPSNHPLHGLPGAPATPFHWPNGLLEYPVPVAQLGPFTLPFLGGIYLRYLPFGVIQHMRQQLSGPQWTYLHPYDFDAQESYYRFPERSLLSSLLLWRCRERTFNKLARLFSDHSALFAQPSRFDDWTRIPSFVEGLPIFSASTASAA